MNDQMASPAKAEPCPYCGSVFFEHSCSMLPGWIALMVARTRKRARR